MGSSGARVDPALVFDIRRYGALCNDTSGTGTSSHDDTVAIQAAIDACYAAGGGVVLISGKSRCTATLITPQDAQVSVIIRGLGKKGASRLRWSADLGAGEYAIKGIRISGGSTVDFENLDIKGPGASTLGVVTCNMRGIRFEAGMRATKCRISGFYAGLTLVGDHVQMTDCNIGANYYGVYWADQITQGDVLVVDCDFSGNSFASWAIADAAVAAGMTVVHSHLGFGPYAVYFESTAAAAGQLALASVQFLGTSFEACGNGVFYDESFRVRMLGVEFINCGNFSRSTSELKIVARSYDAPFKVYSLDGVRMMRTGISFSASFHGDEAIMLSAGILSGLRLIDCGLPTAAVSADSIGLPLFKATVSNSGNMFSDGATDGFIAGSQTTVASQRLTSYQSSERVVGISAGSFLAGITIQGGSGSNLAVVATKGRSLKVGTTAAVAASAYVEIDTADRTKVKTYSAGQKIGMDSGTGAASGGAGTAAVDLYASGMVVA